MSAQTLDAVRAEVLTEAGARELLADIRAAISAAQDLLRLAWRQRIWVPLGHASWDDFVATELGDIRLKLPVDDRRAEVGAWRAEGASVRAIASALGVSAGTVSSDLHTVEGVNSADPPKGVGSTDPLTTDEGVPQPHTPAVVLSLDGRRRPARSTSARGEDLARPVSLRVLDALAAAGTDGLTLVEVSRRLKIRDGSSSGALSRLEVQGHCTRTGERRNGRSVYVLVIHLA